MPKNAVAPQAKEQSTPAIADKPRPRSHLGHSPASTEADLEAELRAACWIDRGILAALGVLAVVALWLLAAALRLFDSSWGIMFELARYIVS